MEKLLASISGVIDRFTSRSFVVTVVVIFLVATRPDMSIEQVIGLLVGAGVVTARAIAEDVKEVKTPQLNGNAE